MANDICCVRNIQSHLGGAYRISVRPRNAQLDSAFANRLCASDSPRIQHPRPAIRGTDCSELPQQLTNCSCTTWQVHWSRCLRPHRRWPNREEYKDRGQHYLRDNSRGFWFNHLPPPSNSASSGYSCYFRSVSHARTVKRCANECVVVSAASFK
jgi:hypothetical protein